MTRIFTIAAIAAAFCFSPAPAQAQEPAATPIKVVLVPREIVVTVPPGADVDVALDARSLYPNIIAHFGQVFGPTIELRVRNGPDIGRPVIRLHNPRFADVNGYNAATVTIRYLSLETQP